MTKLAASLDYIMDQGSDWQTTVVLKDDDGVALDTTGYSFIFTAAARYEDTSDVLRSDGGSPNVTITHTPAEGKIVIDIADTVTDGLTDERLVYDLEVTESGGDKYRALRGAIVIRPKA